MELSCRVVSFSVVRWVVVYSRARGGDRRAALHLATLASDVGAATPALAAWAKDLALEALDKTDVAAFAGLDAAVVANHEFDKGAENLALQYGTWGGFDLLAANYDFEDSALPWATDLEEIILPSRLCKQQSGAQLAR